MRGGRALAVVLAIFAATTAHAFSGTASSVQNAAVACSTSVAAVNLTAQGADIALATIYTPSVAGWYRVTGEIIVTRAATTSSTRPQLNISWTNGDNSTGQSVVAAATAATNSLTTRATFTQNFWSAAAAIQYETTGYQSLGGTSMQYALRLRVETVN